MESQRVGTGLGEMITLGKHHCLPYDDELKYQMLKPEARGWLQGVTALLSDVKRVYRRNKLSMQLLKQHWDSVNAISPITLGPSHSNYPNSNISSGTVRHGTRPANLMMLRLHEHSGSISWQTIVSSERALQKGLIQNVKADRNDFSIRVRRLPFFWATTFMDTALDCYNSTRWHLFWLPSGCLKKHVTIIAPCQQICSP